MGKAVEIKELNLLRRYRVWAHLRAGYSPIFRQLPDLVGGEGDTHDFDFVFRWKRNGIVAISEIPGRPIRVKLANDIGPRPPSDNGLIDPNQCDEERDPKQRMWNSLRIFKAVAQRELFAVSPISDRLGVAALRSWGSAGILDRHRHRHGRGFHIVLRRDLGAIAPLALEGRVYDPNSDEFIVVAEEGGDRPCG